MNPVWLKLKGRSPLICKEISDSMSDIVCLCEVDHIDDLYGKFMTDLGYQFYTASRRGKDSVMLAFDPSKFEYVEHSEVQHDKL